MITTKELSKITSILLQYAKDRGDDPVSFSNEDSYYQKIWHEDRNLEDTPVITIGSIDEDIAELKKIINDEPPTASDLERLGAVFTSLGAVLSKK